MYPYRIRIKDPSIEKILDELAKDRTVTITDDKTSLLKLAHKMKPIRKDIFIGFDRKNYDSNISLKKKDLKIEKKGKDYIFKI